MLTRRMSMWGQGASTKRSGRTGALNTQTYGTSQCCVCHLHLWGTGHDHRGSRDRKHARVGGVETEKYDDIAFTRAEGRGYHGNWACLHGLGVQGVSKWWPLRFRGLTVFLWEPANTVMFVPRQKLLYVARTMGLEGINKTAGSLNNVRQQFKQAHRQIRCR